MTYRDIISDKYYLYRHIRLDKNEPFYVGVGTRSRKDMERGYYSRAYDKSNRGIFWKNIAAITDYEVEILLESNDFDFILHKEKEFISLYGRRITKLGPLCNITEGGRGCGGRKHTEETKRKISYKNKGRKLNEERRKLCSLARKGKPISDEHRRKLSEFNKRRMDNKSGNHKLSVKVYQYSISGDFIKEWSSLKDIQREMNIITPRISEACRSKSHYCKGFIWLTETDHKIRGII